MGPLSQKIHDYRNNGGDPRLYMILMDLGQRQKAIEQSMVTLAGQFAELAKILNMHSQAVNNLAMGAVASRSRQTGIEVSTDPYLTGEAGRTSETHIPHGYGSRCASADVRLHEADCDQYVSHMGHHAIYASQGYVLRWSCYGTRSRQAYA